MTIVFSGKALRDYQNLSKELQRTIDKQLDFLLTNLRHQSLRAKKYDEAKDVWQARVTGSWRLYSPPARVTLDIKKA